MPPKAPMFSASLSRRTGEEETLTIAVAASCGRELAERVALADDVAGQQLKRSNDRVLASADKLAETNGAMFARAVRVICEAAGVPVPAGYEAPAPNGHAEEGDHADDSAGTVHAPEDS